jgi:two-component system NtrC family response regulator/two-component system nitrogen regulation response regulator GlnG
MKQVLVIEDDRSLAQLLTTILSLAGFKVDVVFTGNDGMASLRQSMPDAIVLDMHLPGVSGREIYQMLEQQHQAFRVVVCSADVQLVTEYRSRGANGITKPIESIAEFTAMIARITAQVVAV